MKRKYILKALGLSLAALLSTATTRADDVRHTYAGDPLNSFYIDDAGGSVNNGGSNNSYFLNLLDIDQSAFGTLFLYADDGTGTTVDDGLIDEDFQNGGGIGLYPLSSLPMSSGAGEIGLTTDTPLTPVTFDATQSGLIVEQVSYTSEDPADKFVIVEYRVTNPTGGNVTARIALSNDFDVDLKSDDATVGFDNTVAPMVFQQEAPPIDPNYTTVGVSLIRGTLAQYRLEACGGVFGPCDIFANDNDLIRTAYFQNGSGQVGDLTGGTPNQDFAVTISAQLDTLAPGESTSVVFCYNLGQGGSASDGLNDCRQSANNCSDFYDNEIQNCGNSLVNYDENCDDGDIDQSDSCPDGPTGSCQPASCGDGYVWNSDGGSETCDDGDGIVNDRCPDGPNGNCQDAICGDGYVWDSDGGSEECDNGGANSNSAPDACRTNCQNPSCGDSVKDTGEGCDDGDANNNDACRNDCVVASCGDGVIYNTEGGTEQCDNGGANSNSAPDACRTNCQNPSCGDGVTDSGEQCDDDNGSNTDGCLNSCLSAKCGDGFVRVGFEFCDDGNNTNGDGCSADCQSFESCGNGVLNPGESCDDGNNNTSDGCPDGNNGICQPASCGDGFRHNTGGGTEQCDDGNITNSDGCSSTCTTEGVGTSINPPLAPPVCGDGNVDEALGEQCDDGNDDEFDGCDNSCQWEIVLQGSGGSDEPRENFGCRLNSGHAAGGAWGLFPLVAALLLLGRHRLKKN
jgi:cysteine-rich repeat protein